MTFWVKDPANNGVPSVTLSLMLISFTGAFGACCLHVAGRIESTSSFLELFLTCSGLYLGRRFKMGNFSSQESDSKNDA